MLATEVAWYCPECRAATVSVESNDSGIDRKNSVGSGGGHDGGNGSTSGDTSFGHASNQNTGGADSQRLTVAPWQCNGSQPGEKSDNASHDYGRGVSGGSGKKRKRPSNARNDDAQERLGSTTVTDKNSAFSAASVSGGVGKDSGGGALRGTADGHNSNNSSIHVGVQALGSGIGGSAMLGGTRARRRVMRGDDGQMTTIARDDERPKDIAGELGMEVGELIRLNKARLSRLRVDSKLHAGTHLLVPNDVVEPLLKGGLLDLVPNRPGVNGTTVRIAHAHRQSKHHPPDDASSIGIGSSGNSGGLGGGGDITNDGAGKKHGDVTGGTYTTFGAANDRENSHGVALPEKNSISQDVFMAERILDRRSRKVCHFFYKMNHGVFLC